MIKTMRVMNNERGVAMVTVLLVAAILTVVTSTAAFITVQELRADTDDRKAAGALAYAEAGIDRTLLAMKTNTWTFNQITSAGCDALHPALTLSGEIGNGTFDVEVRAATDPAVNVPVANRFSPAADACTDRKDPRRTYYLAITSTGRHPTAKRIVRQMVKYSVLKLPIGVFAEAINANGSGQMLSISLVTPGDLEGREKIAFTGNDPYYTLDDFYPGLSSTTKIPAAAHAVGEIYYIQGGTKKKVREHPPSPNCTANPTNIGGAEGQSVWDGSNGGGPVTSGCPGQSSFPPTSKFTDADRARVTPKPELEPQDYLALRDAARSTGLYCIPSGPNLSCSKAGGGFYTVGGTITDAEVSGLPNNFIAYVDFPSGGDPFSVQRTVKFKTEIGPCDPNPTYNKSAILIVRNGSLTMQSGSVLTGAVILPEGQFDSEGTFTTHGTIIAEKFWIRGGATFEMSPCWIENMPGPWLDFTPTQWSEVDR